MRRNYYLKSIEDFKQFEGYYPVYHLFRINQRPIGRASLAFPCWLIDIGGLIRSDLFESEFTVIFNSDFK